MTNWSNLYGEVLGIVSQPQVMYTRSGSNLNLDTVGDPISIHAVVPSYNVYFNDSWHVRPSVTLTYGLGSVSYTHLSSTRPPIARTRSAHFSHIMPGPSRGYRNE